MVKRIMIFGLSTGLAGCACCQEQQQAAVPSGMQIMSAPAQPMACATEAIPTLGMSMGSIHIPVPRFKMYAVPRPQIGPQVVGIPIMAGQAAPMAMAMPQPMMAAPTATYQPQYVTANAPQSVAPQGRPTAQSSPCTQSAGECCNTNGSASCDGNLDEMCRAIEEQIATAEILVNTKNGGVAVPIQPK